MKIVNKIFQRKDKEEVAKLNSIKMYYPKTTIIRTIRYEHKSIYTYLYDIVNVSEIDLNLQKKMEQIIKCHFKSMRKEGFLQW